MRRLLGAVAAVLLIVVAIIAWRSERASAELPPAFAPPAAALADAGGRVPVLAPVAPEPSPASREERRFARYDKDRNAEITAAEYLASRQKAFAKLDRNGDGRLDFDEYAVKTQARFTTADADGSGRLSASEFATTAVQRKARAACPPTIAADADA